MKVYALFSGEVLLPFAIRGFRKDIVKFYEEEYIGESWQKGKKKGYTIRPCEIKPIKR